MEKSGGAEKLKCVSSNQRNWIFDNVISLGNWLVGFPMFIPMTLWGMTIFPNRSDLLWHTH